ncbi:MAG: hypothetical protein ABI777_08390 [Betaproteobacteria bacterium]
MIQNADIAFVVLLAALSALMWLGRASTVAVLKFVPLVIAVLGTLATALLLVVGQMAHWQTPDSSGILLVLLALAVSIIIAAAGWIGFYWQRKRSRSKVLRPQTRQDYKIAIAIVVMWSVLGSPYLFYRNHRSSHNANVVALSFAAKSRYLFSLDQNGQLKKWDLERRSQIGEWQLRSGARSKMFAREDATAVFVLSEGQLNEYRLSDRLPTPIRRGGYLDLADLGGGDAALLSGPELVIFRSGGNQPEPGFPVGNETGADAKSVSAVTAGSLIVLFSDKSGRIFEFGDGHLHPREHPDWLDQKALALLANQTASSSSMSLTFWRDTVVQSEGPILRGFQPQEKYPIPLISRGVEIRVLLGSRAAGGPLAIGAQSEIYIKHQVRYDTQDEVWLNGVIGLPGFLANLFPPGAS